MNRSKGSLTSRLAKKMKKEVHNSQKEYLKPEDRLYSDQLTTQEMLKKFPKKLAKKTKSLIDSMQKRVKLKKKLREGARSRRTTPGQEEGQQAAPAYVNKEGARWIKTLTSQNKVKQKSLRKKLSKKTR